MSTKIVKNQRDIVVKMLLNADEFIEFDKGCKSLSFTHSAALRHMANRFANHRREIARTVRTQPVHKLHMNGFRLLN
jgi:hypothetical protein